MSKLVIVLFTVLAVVATNASRTPEELQDYRRDTENIYIEIAKGYITDAYSYVVGKYDKLEEDIKQWGEQAVANWNKDIAILINETYTHIEFRKQERVCMQDAAHLADKTAEASANLTNCVSEKSKISNNTELEAIADAKRALHYQAEDLRDKLDPCINDNKSDAVEAEICLLKVERDAVRLFASADSFVNSHLEKMESMFTKIKESLGLCNNEYGAPNYSKYAQSIVDKVTKCVQAGVQADEDARHSREVSPQWLQSNGQPLPNSAPIPIQHQKLQETHDEDDLLATE